MKRPNLRGMGIALITPFKNDETIDYNALGQLLDFQIGSGADYLVVLGTTAETPALSVEEKRELYHFITEKVRERVPIVLGVGGNCTSSVIETIKGIDFKGISAILSVAPYYNKPSQEGLYQHFKAIAKACPVPVILYNVPGRTGVNILPQTILRLVRELPENIVAIKEASGNIAQADEILKNKPQEFMVISGDDGITYPLMMLGAVGVISVIGNALPYEFGKMVHLALDGKYEEARKYHRQFAELIRLLFVDGNPAGIKSMLSAMGKIENKLRLPLVPAQSSTYEKIREAMRDLNM